MSVTDLDQARARSKFACEQGEIWVEKKKAELDALPTSTVVLIDIATGDYVAGKSFLEVNPIFTQRFGSSALGFVYRVRDRSFIGGGIG
jgi:hypothetical protein